MNTSIKLLGLICIPILLMSSIGCASFSTADVRNGMSAEGFYTGLRHESIRSAGISKDTSYVDIGKTQKRATPNLDKYIYRFYRFDLSVPLERNEYIDFGVSGGHSLISGGAGYTYNEDDGIYRVNISGGLFLNGSVSRFWGDTDKILDMDVFGVWVGQNPPIFTIGTRLSWNEGMKDSGFFGAFIIQPKDTDIEIECGITLWNNPWFHNEETDTYSDLGIAVRYFF